MHTNNTHNNWSAEQLSNIIDSIRDSTNGKCSIRMVAERLGKSIWSTWQILNETGLITRIYRESLDILFEQIQENSPRCTISELYKNYGESWKNESSFRSSLYKNGILRFSPAIRAKRKDASRLLTDYQSNGYDFSSLTAEEIAEMYGLSVKTVYKNLSHHSIPYTHAPKGRKPKVKA